MRQKIAQNLFHQTKSILSSFRIIESIPKNHCKIAQNFCCSTQSTMHYPLELLMPKTQTQQVWKMNMNCWKIWDFFRIHSWKSTPNVMDVVFSLLSLTRVLIQLCRECRFWKFRFTKNSRKKSRKPRMTGRNLWIVWTWREVDMWIVQLWKVLAQMERWWV